MPRKFAPVKFNCRCCGRETRLNPTLRDRVTGANVSVPLCQSCLKSPGRVVWRRFEPLGRTASHD